MPPSTLMAAFPFPGPRVILRARLEKILQSCRNPISTATGALADDLWTVDERSIAEFTEAVEEPSIALLLVR